MNSGAHFSEDRAYRYVLWRIWDPDKPLVMFIGLNPSTANETEQDPTIRRVVRFAADNGYGGVYMMNLFAFVSTNPAKLRAEANPLNDQWLAVISERCADICFGWGAFGGDVIRQRGAEIISRFPHAKCLGRTGAGHPKHPLYLPADAKMILFND